MWRNKKSSVFDWSVGGQKYEEAEKRKAQIKYIKTLCPASVGKNVLVPLKKLLSDNY